jgi:hypothetical protein
MQVKRNGTWQSVAVVVGPRGDLRFGRRSRQARRRLHPRPAVRTGEPSPSRTRPQGCICQAGEYLIGRQAKRRPGTQWLGRWAFRSRKAAKRMAAYLHGRRGRACRA